jgi:hypothetical protein
MKFKLSLAENDYQTVIDFESGPYDGIPPMDFLYIENRIRRAAGDRLAIACALIMRDFLASEVTFPRPCSPEIGRELENFLAPLNVRVMNMEFEPEAKPISERTAVLMLPAPYEVQGPELQSGQVKFGIADDQAFRSSLSVTELQIGCNLRLLSADNLVSMGLGILGLCILFAEDFSISRIVLPEALAREIPNLDALRSLTLYSNIELVTKQ